MNSYSTVPKLFPEDASALKSDLDEVLVYQSKTDNSALGVEKDKFYYVDKDGKHFLFSLGDSQASNPPLLIYTCTTPVVITDETKSGFNGGIGEHVIKTSSVQKNSIYKVLMHGRIEIAEESSDTVIMTIKLGNTTLYTETFGLLGEDVGVFISFDLSITDVGSSGQVYLVAGDSVGPFLTHTFPKNLQTNSTPFTVDLAADKTIDIVFESTGEDGVATILSSSIIKLN